MLDDDIQYLGSRIKLRDPPRYSQRTLNGIALHIEKSDGNEAYVLNFHRDKSSTVHVGRRPGTQPESRTLDQEKGKAMFRCAVVSRKHAKIAFSDSGIVYLIDLGSHHGTHIRKPGETSSRMLERDLATQLSDGDIITFGKSVGRNEEMVRMVRPVVARVQLLYNGPSTSTIKPLVVPDSSSPATSKSHSGRYGLHSPSSSSSDEAYYGQSDVYSDIEEIPPPKPDNRADSPQEEPQSKTESHLGRAFEALKRRLLPPSSIPSIPAAPSQRDISPRLEEQSPINSESSSPSSVVVLSPSDLPPIWSLSTNGTSPLPLLPRYPSISSIDLSDNFFSLPPINPANVVDEGNHSRSESPMDLASPSPPPEQEPRIIGGWAEYSSPSPSESEPVATPSDNGVPEVIEAAEMSIVTVPPTAAEHEEDHEAEVVVSEEPAPSSTSATNEKDQEKEQITLDSAQFVTRTEYEVLKAKCTNLQDELDKLQLQRRKYKSKFNANVHTVTDKFHELEDKMNDMTAQCTLVMDRIENITSADVPDIEQRIDELGDESGEHDMRIEWLESQIYAGEEKVEDEETEIDTLRLQEEKERTRKYLDALSGLIEEMKALRAATERDIQSELENLRKLREDIRMEQNASTTLAKRKRSIDDEGDPGADVEEFDPANSDSQVEIRTPHCDVEFQTQPELGDRPSPRKRARKIVSVAAQTATAITMGAVAAWFALAFS